MQLTELPLDLVRKELARVDTLLLEEGWSSVEMVREISHHILGAGGKRIRPLLLLTAARALGHHDDWTYRLAASVELLHTATLMHDDVVDHSDWRRGRVTAHARWGHSASVLSGDVLFAKAMRILVDYGDLAILDAVTTAIIRVCEGEVMEISVSGDLETAAETYLRIIDAKTAALISVCCRVGAMAAGAPPDVVTALGAYGTHLGMAFQIVDDVLDLSADKDRWGKPLGKDLDEGTLTLPLIYTLHGADAADAERLRALLRSPQCAADAMDEILRLVHR